MTSDAAQTLHQLNRSTGYASMPGVIELELLGYAETGKSKFGQWARITAEGRTYATQNITPEVALGPTQVGLSLQDASSGIRHVDANQALGNQSAIQLPVDVLHVEVLFSLDAMMRRVIDRLINGQDSRSP